MMMGPDPMSPVFPLNNRPHEIRTVARFQEQHYRAALTLQKSFMSLAIDSSIAVYRGHINQTHRSVFPLWNGAIVPCLLQLL